MYLGSKPFVSLCPTSFVPIMTTDGTHMPLVGVCSVVNSYLSLSNVYYILKLLLNLTSVDQ